MGSVSVLEAFSIGIGPSSSHTVGPMRAARKFALELKEREFLEEVGGICVELYGSLAMTGKGHATDKAVVLGLEGESPEGVDPDSVEERFFAIKEKGKLKLFGKWEVDVDVQFLKGKKMPYHSNAMRFKAFNRKQKQCHFSVYYSVGGGFVVSHEEATKGSVETQRVVPYPYKSAKELLSYRLPIWQVVLANELAIFESEEVLREGIGKIWTSMQTCMARGLEAEGELPGGLGVQRRAKKIFSALKNLEVEGDPTLVMEWVSVFSLAVNEENAAGGRVVTAPTNGSAGVIPAVLHYAKKFVKGFDEKSIFVFFLTANAMLNLYKENASISAAEMGCQGEIGVSSSMAAAGLCALLGGGNEQIENAAEIAMEHHLGLTCDPVAGLVQIPCIERNTMGSLKAINAARLALRGDGQHRVSLDAVIAAMKETGKNMKEIYKETSEGGLALQVNLAATAC